MFGKAAKCSSMSEALPHWLGHSIFIFNTALRLVAAALGITGKTDFQELNNIIWESSAGNPSQACKFAACALTH